jgi:PAS domain S-box-containing protein
MSSSYSFLDVAVLDPVRQRFAAGDALLILSPDLAQVLWANGPGAALFGYRDIETVIDAAGVLPPIARRQLAATAGFPEIGTERAVTLRLAAGMSSHTVALLASTIAMPDGERAILLAAPTADAESGRPPKVAPHALSGFTEGGEFLAFVDGQGGVEAASEGFASLGFSTEALAGLVAEAGGDRERLVKRLVRIGARAYPAGIARLTDDPARHLLVVIDEGRVEEPEAEATPDERPAYDAPEPTNGAIASPNRPTTGGAAPEAEAPHQHDHWYFASEESDARIRPAGAEPAAPAPPAEERPVSEQPVAAARPSAEIDRNAAPVRFVWRTDADGAFSAVSPEFAAAVGRAGADVIGRRFGDVAAAFGLDPTGEIAQLLERRDTWSGRTVRWPAAGLRIPVDLAALPVYNRNREFEGFRGFGVARPADAVHDPDTADLLETSQDAAGDRMAHEAEPDAAPQENTTADKPVQADPFKGEVPALTIEPKPDRRFADKVIRLAEHRPPAGDKGLSNVERSAFREIGERLKKDSAAGAETADAAGPAHEGETPQTDPVGIGGAAKPAKEPAIAGTELAAPDDLRPAEPAAEAPPKAVPLGPATEPGRVNSADSAGEPAATGSEDNPEDDGARLEAVVDEEDAADLARLDDVPPAAVDANGEAGPIRPRSLLDYAGQAADTGDRAEAAAGPVASDDSMAAADFADARDDETLPAADESNSDRDEAEGRPPESAAPEASGDIGEDVAPQSVAAAAGPRLPVPPLRSDGVMPSAFAAANAPDTSILAKLPVPLLIHSGDTLHYANDEFLALSGYDALEDLAHAGGLDALFADPYADDGAADQSDRALRLRTQDGREFPVDALLRTVPWRGGKALMLVLRRSGENSQVRQEPAPASPGAAGDMVQPDVADLKARIAEMRTIIDTATDGVVLIGRDGLIRSISRPAEALFSFDSDEVAGKPFASLFAIESQRAASDYLASLSEPGVASVLNDGREVIGREAQGRFIPLFMTVGRLPGDSGYCAVVRDITQWKRAEEDLTQARAVAERASSQKTDFLARISHEIRTPLNAIIGFSELMVDEKFGPVANDRYRDYLRDINRSGNHVLDLVNDLLDISKIEAGQQEMDYEAVSLNDALAETVALMQPQANRERVIIRSSLASRLPEVVADLRSIRQIALNILSNAIRYTQAGGQVIVSTAYESSGDVVMRVRDTGVGMTQAEIEQALKPFKQLNALKRGRGDGTGLGLPLTKAMVEANRAQFTIHSTPGEGTLVEIAFPSTRVLAE